MQSYANIVHILIQPLSLRSAVIFSSQPVRLELTLNVFIFIGTGTDHVSADKRDQPNRRSAAENCVNSYCMQLWSQLITKINY
jgi:hypothetical protein